MGLIIIPGQEPDPEPDPEASAVITPEQITAWVRETIARNKGARRNHESQELADRLIERLYDDGEITLAAAVLQLVAARVGGWHHAALEVLMQLGVDIAQSGGLEQTCRVCGCTNDRACPGGCSWVEFDLCSECDRKRRAAIVRAMGPGPGRE